MQKTRLISHGFIVLLLFLTTFGNASMVAQAGNGNDELKADPRLLQMATENPDAVFMVIVQKEAKNKDLKDVEGEVLKGGGLVKKQLDLIVSFSAEMTGKEITKLARHPMVRWISADAPMVSTAAPGMDSVRDEFKTKSYSGNNGTVAWSGNWIETGETTDPGKGAMTVATINRCSGGGGYCLRLDPDPTKSLNASVYRQLDLSNTVSATLSFYRNNEFNLAPGGVAGTGETVKLQISADGGTVWTTLRTYSSTEFLGVGVDTFSISAYASSNTRIRFTITSQQSGYRFLYIDDVEIAFARPSVFRSAVKADQLGSLNGSGVTVAVIDSGITTLHPDFLTGITSRVSTSAKFGSSFTTEDLYGHGTHVAGIIGGSGSASNGKYKGMAPGVNLLNVKVTDDYGMTYESDVVNAMQWVYNNKSTYNIRVVNLSMNSTVAQSYHTSPLAAAAEILWFNGIVVVVSAGNNGTGNGSVPIYPPANDPFVITVGATEDKGTPTLSDDTLAVFSAYGMTEDGFSKPDLVAPGRNVVAPLGGLFNIIYQLHPLHRVDNFYFRMSGTSMSAPVVSGAVALLLQDEPNLNPDQVKYRLMSTANKSWTGYNSSTTGAGYLDIFAGVNGTSTETANTGIFASQMLSTGSEPITWGSAGWNSAGWNTAGWNSAGWNSAGWNTAGWNTAGWNSGIWDQ